MRVSIASVSLLVSLLACDKQDDPPTIKCGAEDCGSDEICVEERFDPSCTTLTEGATCPQGQTQGLCGGAGLDCCCPPDPPSEYRCESALACVDEPACDCLGAICPDNKSCAQLDEGSPLFVCDSLPVP